MRYEPLADSVQIGRLQAAILEALSDSDLPLSLAEIKSKIGGAALSKNTVPAACDRLRYRGFACRANMPRTRPIRYRITAAGATALRGYREANPPAIIV